MTSSGKSCASAAGGSGAWGFTTGVESVDIRASGVGGGALLSSAAEAAADDKFIGLRGSGGTNPRFILLKSSIAATDINKSAGMHALRWRAGRICAEPSYLR